jgi:hypothetical protein
VEDQPVGIADERAVRAAARAARAAARSAARAVVPTRSDAFAHLDLSELRAYRAQLESEEDRASYWRRILQAKLDTSRAGTATRNTDLGALRPLLADDRVGSGRRALVQVGAIEDLPSLPSLSTLWDREPKPGDEAGRAALEADLEGAERELSLYRTRVHEQLAAATAELVARYRENPSACLTALPLPREELHPSVR